ncbi:MAG: YetF domain-containing protein [Candidatus Nanoarchaeia archaeon]|jgi:uncharacterized membrane protein YcaP (DUF421 family)
MFEWIGWGGVLEVLFRTVTVFFFTFFLMRLRGHKQLTQLNVFDVLIIIALGSAVGDVMIYGDSVVPLTTALIAIATVIILVLIIENFIAIAPPKIIKLIEGKEEILIHKGKVDWDVLRKVNIHEEELKSMLRSKGIYDYRDASIVYLEPDGSISVRRRIRRKNGKNKK